MKKVYFLVLFGTVLSSLGPAIFKNVIEQMNRNFGISLLLLVGGLSATVIYLTDSFVNHKNGDKKRIKPSVSEMIQLALCGVFAAVHFLAFVIAMQIGSVTETTMTVRVSPVMSILMGHFFLNEKVKSWKIMIISSALCLGSVFLMQDMSNISLDQKSTTAMLLGILSALAGALRKTLTRNITSEVQSLPNLFVLAVSMTVGGLFMIMGGLTMIPFTGEKLFSLPNMNQVLMFTFLGINGVISGSIVIWACQKTGNMGVVTFFEYLIPLFGGIAAYLICGEKGFNYFNLTLSFALVSLGVYLLDRAQKKQAEKPKP